MTALALGTMLIGMVLGIRFRFVILPPVILVGSTALAVTALVTGMSALGAGIAVASAAPAAIGATSEDPKAFGKALIFVALGEGVAVYGLLISILIINKL